MSGTYPQADRWHRVHKPGDPECPYIVCKCEPKCLCWKPTAPEHQSDCPLRPKRQEVA